MRGAFGAQLVFSSSVAADLHTGEFSFGFRRQARWGVFLIWDSRPKFNILDSVEVATWAVHRSRKATIKGTENAWGWWSSVLHTSGDGVKEERDKVLTLGLSKGRKS